MMMLQPPPVAGDEATSMIVIGADNGQFAARTAIEAVGARLITCLDWQEASSLVLHASSAVLLVEAEGAGDDLLADALPALDAVTAALDIPVVIALEERSIDIVAASMISAQTQMLCAPTITDRVVALAIAAEQRGATWVHDILREGEAARLHRLNEEVARIAEVLARLTRRGSDDPSDLPVVSDRPMTFRPDHPNDVIIDAGEVRRAIRARRMRDQHFGNGLFEDPAWDIMLDLFAADLERSQVSVSSLCIAAAVAPTTALRWIAKLTDSGLLERHPDPFDRRRAFMELSPGAARAMRDHVSALRRAGLPLG